MALAKWIAASGDENARTENWSRPEVSIHGAGQMDRSLWGREWPFYFLLLNPVSLICCLFSPNCPQIQDGTSSNYLSFCSFFFLCPMWFIVFFVTVILINIPHNTSTENTGCDTTFKVDSLRHTFEQDFNH